MVATNSVQWPTVGRGKTGRTEDRTDSRNDNALVSRSRELSRDLSRYISGPPCNPLIERYLSRTSRGDKKPPGGTRLHVRREFGLRDSSASTPLAPAMEKVPHKVARSNGALLTPPVHYASSELERDTEDRPAIVPRVEKFLGFNWDSVRFPKVIIGRGLEQKVSQDLIGVQFISLK